MALGRLPGELPIGIARIGRAAYVAYRATAIAAPVQHPPEVASIMDDFGLSDMVELNTEFDGPAGVLTLGTPRA